MRITLVITVFSLVCAHAQPIAAPAACAQAGQTTEGAFDPGLVTFVEHPKPLPPPFDELTNIEFDVIARVAGVRPLILEVLDGRYRQPVASDAFNGCGIVRIYSVEAGSRSVLPSLRRDDLVMAKLTMDNGSALVSPVLRGIEKYSGEYFHDAKAAGECSNRSGELASITYRDYERITVFRDGSVVYRDRNGNRLANTRMPPEELAGLLEAFGKVDFEHFGGTLHPIDAGMPMHAITLDCSRYQRVLLDERESLMAPVTKAFDDLRSEVLHHARYWLRYKTKSEIELLDWPFPLMPLDRWETIKSAGSRAIQQELPAALLAKLPAASGQGRDVYVRQGAKLFYLSRTCADQNPRCRTFESLQVYEVRDAGVVIAALPPSGVLTEYSSVLWPSNTGFPLGGMAQEGRSLALEDYVAHEPLYQQVLASQNGLTFIEGRYIYRGVRMTLEER